MILPLFILLITFIALSTSALSTTIDKFSSDELCATIITFTLASANFLKTSAIISAKSNPAPLTLIIAAFSIKLIALTILFVDLVCSLITVPGASGLNVFLILTGIFFFITGSNARGWSILAPK